MVIFSIIQSRNLAGARAVVALRFCGASSLTMFRGARDRPVRGHAAIRRDRSEKAAVYLASAPCRS